MIIRHSLKLLEQLSEIEDLIQKIEKYMEENGIESEREKFKEAVKASLNQKEN